MSPRGSAVESRLLEDAVISGRYRVIKLLGEGGMGRVYQVVDERSGEQRALKLLHDSMRKESDVARFKREFRALARLNHPNCVGASDLGREGERWYFTQDYMAGGSLDGYPNADPDFVLGVALQVLAALDYIHSRDIVHRDIKPPNILLDQAPRPDRPIPRAKVCDLGVAQVGDLDEQQGLGRIVGSLRYMAPEQIEEGRLDPRADLYALGIVLYERLAGKHPLATEGEPHEAKQWLRLHVDGRARPLREVANVPEEVERALMPLLERDRNRRYKTAAQAFDALSTCARHLQTDIAPLVRRPYLAAGQFVGREGEAARIDSLFRRALEPQEQSSEFVVFISGQGGVGKSSLLARMLRGCYARDVHVVVGTCRAETGNAYEGVSPWLGYLKKRAMERLSDTARQTAAEALARAGLSEVPSGIRDAPALNENATADVTLSGTIDRPVGIHGEWESALGVAAPAWETYLTTDTMRAGTQGSSPDATIEAALAKRDAEKWRFVRATSDDMVAGATSQPVLFVIEDAQWADEPTLELIWFWIRAVVSAKQEGRDPKVAFAITHRVTNRQQLQKLQESAREYGVALTVALEPLKNDSASELVASMLMVAPSEDVRSFTSKILRDAEASPLLVAQLLLALLGRGHLRYGDEGWNLREAAEHAHLVPTGIHLAIGDRASRFSVTTKQVLAAAAVLGKRFSMAALSAVATRDEMELLDALDEAVREGFVEETGDALYEYSFCHDRFREAIYESLDEEERRKLHRRTAEDIRARIGGGEQESAELAFHFRAADMPQEAYRYGVLAGKAAIDSYAFARAAELFQSALEQAKRAGVEVAPSVTEKYGDAALQSGRYDEAESCYRALLTGNLPKNQRIDVMRRVADLEWRRGDLSAAGPALEAVMEQYGFQPPSTRLGLVVRTVGQLMLFILYALIPSLWRSKPPPDVERREGMARLCNRAGEAYNLQNYLKMVFYIFSGGNLAARMGKRPAGAVGLAQVGYALGTQGKYPLGHRYLAKAEEHVVGGSPVDRSWLKLLSAMVYFCAGEPASAVERMRESEQALGKSRDPLMLQYLYAFNAAGLASLGRLHEALKAGHDLVRMGDELGDGRSKVWGRGGVARAEWRLDQLEQATRTCEEGVAAGGSNLASKLYMIAYRAMVYSLRGIHDRARVQGALDAAFEYWKMRFSVPTALVDGATLVAVGLYWKATGDIDQATSARVDKLIAGRTRYTRKLRMTTTLFLAGCAAVEVGRGRLEQGKERLAEAAEFAQANHLLGELIDVYLVARAALPEGDPERKRYLEKLADLQARFGAAEEARIESARPKSGV